MISRRFLVGTTLTAVVTAMAVMGTGGPATPATRPASQPLLAAHAVEAPPATGLTPLQEFRTPGGWFYTLNPGEATNAVQQFKFTKSANIGMLHANAMPGGVAIHRLRVKTGAPSYLLSISPAEIKDPRFVDEGVLGYADGAQHPGQLRLLRFSNQGKWRVLADGPANVNNMKAMGYAVDGPLGWFQP